MAELLDGKKISEKIRSELKEQVEKIRNQAGIVPCLATILVGNDPASATYVKMKGKACEAVGMKSVKIEMPESTTTEELLEQIDSLNSDDSVHGILLQHPVPAQIDERACFDRIKIEKDVDGVTTAGYGLFSFGLDAYPSCTPAGIMELIRAYGLSVSGKNAVVVGRSAILGRPLAALLVQDDATVTVCHSKTQNLQEHVAGADFVFACVGKPEFVKGQWIKEGSVVIDAGYNEGNIGDADFTGCEKKASWITPVPGGVGPMTITMLLKHTVISAAKKGSVPLK